ncbi:hypothetical protein ABZY11_13695, partial [Streptomyces sp. NPDC006510]
MGFGNWFRRGDRQPPGASSRDGAEAGAGTGHGPEPEVGRSDGGADQRNDGWDGGWDGGWRQVAPPAVTVARSSIGVSDGLRFRSGLASWQNLAFAGELGHAVLPSAPVGLIHGVARPGGPRSADPGGPLLLRAARTGPDGEAEPAAGPTPATAGNAPDRGRVGGQPSPATVQRSSGTKSPRSSGNGAPGRRVGGDGATTPEATGGVARAKHTEPAAVPAPASGPVSRPAAAPASQRPANTAPPAPVSLQRARPAAVR